ncbi:unnamed protein product [Ceratitis capitata]|uniref:(Mediterranean fruit fly) hypothetical protein n=1 Tax=Ceratitis capitata TaxID=7213 RepID=A0A811V9P5_CERCA|nr:unnamed protein product [Ceratitis capitata]
MAPKSLTLQPRVSIPASNENDVGVLRLAEPVNDAVIALATSEPANGANAIVTGWASGDKLVDVPVSILSAEKCSSGEYKYGEGEILDSMLCALAENSQACGGLAGNPVVSNNQLVGVASWGYGCGNKGNPAVLTDLAALRSWISVNS